MSSKHRRSLAPTYIINKPDDQPPHDAPEVEVMKVTEQPTDEQMVLTPFSTEYPVTMEMARRCPLCWGGHKGTGVQYSGGSGGPTKYYKCNNCNHTWTATVVIEKIVIEHRRVSIDP